jgi:hypothetical protein
MTPRKCKNDQSSYRSSLCERTGLLVYLTTSGKMIVAIYSGPNKAKPCVWWKF